MRHTTNKQLKFFKNRVYYWQKKLGLFDWKIQVGRDSLPDVVANCIMYENSHGANIHLNLDIPDDSGEWTNQFLDKVALHEVCHVLLHDLSRLVNERVVTDSMRETEEHAVIRRLEHVLIDDNEA